MQTTVVSVIYTSITTPSEKHPEFLPTESIHMGHIQPQSSLQAHLPSLCSFIPRRDSEQLSGIILPAATACFQNAYALSSPKTGKLMDEVLHKLYFRRLLLYASQSTCPVFLVVTFKKTGTGSTLTWWQSWKWTETKHGFP